MTRLLERVLRFRFVAVASAFVICALLGDQDNGDLEYFTDAFHVLGKSGLDLYVARPDIQIGPLAISALAAVDALCGGKIVFAIVGASLALLILTLRSAEAFARELGVGGRAAAQVTLIGGFALAGAWSVAVPGWGHVDDLAALAATVGALRAAHRGVAGRAGLLLAVAIGCKPWGAFAAALLLFLPRDRRLRALLIAAAASAVCWLPFFVGAPRTLSALAHFAIPAHSGTLPQVLGYAVAPWWVRPGQLLACTVAVCVCWRRSRPDLVMLCVAIGRLALDAGAFPYYGVELVLGCLIADLASAAHHHRLPPAPLTLVAWSVLIASHHLDFSSGPAFGLRMTVYAAVLGCAALRGRHPGAVPRPSAHSATGTTFPAQSALNSRSSDADTSADAGVLLTPR